MGRKNNKTRSNTDSARGPKGRRVFRKKTAASASGPKPFLSEIEVDEEIDLHGFTIEEAMGEIEIQIERLKKSGLKTLRIIHGMEKSGVKTIAEQMKFNLKTVWRLKVEKTYQEPHNAGATILTVN